MKRALLALSGLLAAVFTNGCGSSAAPDAQTDDPDEVVGANAVARTATIKSYVLVRPGASDFEISKLISQQM